MKKEYFIAKQNTNDNFTSTRYQMNHYFVVLVNLSINKTTTAGTAEYYDEAWVAIYNATDGEPRTSNLLGRFKNKEYGARYEETCNGKAAKH